MVEVMVLLFSIITLIGGEVGAVIGLVRSGIVGTLWLVFRRGFVTALAILGLLWFLTAMAVFSVAVWVTVEGIELWALALAWLLVILFASGSVAVGLEIVAKPAGPDSINGKINRGA